MWKREPTQNPLWLPISSVVYAFSIEMDEQNCTVLYEYSPSLMYNGTVYNSYAGTPITAAYALLFAQDRGRVGARSGGSGSREGEVALVARCLGLGLDPGVLVRAGVARAARVLAPARAWPAAAPRTRRDPQVARVEVRCSSLFHVLTYPHSCCFCFCY